MGDVVSIDGPAGAGKSSTAKEVAKELGFLYIDTGAMYRSVTLAAIRNNIDINKDDEITQLASDLDIGFKRIDGEYHTYLNGEDVSKEIRSSQVADLVSPVSAIQGVRNVLVEQQRQMAEDNNLVMEGRDIGTNVFPDAKYKFYLTADVAVRARRRMQDYQQNGQDLTEEDIIEEIKKRDKIDSSRKFAPLKKPRGAYVIDTTNLDFNEQVKIIVNRVKDKSGKFNLKQI
ncbi:MAG: (d)CMP kinase [Candidatus Marinimicrobia bacterium]|nr:(d)CMP kinase [Candidatus Neomarinimicrobiota bacterium]